MKITLNRPPARQQGMYLIECIAYIALITIVLGTASVVFFRCWDDNKHLAHNADDIVSALHAGEQWRADIRTATAPLQVLHRDNFDCLTIPVKTGAINYYFFNTQGAVSRQVGTATKPVVLLQHVKSSHMQAVPRQLVTAWRWELELVSLQKKVRMQPLFTFETVAGANIVR